jgi:hypothetical protein
MKLTHGSIASDDWLIFSGTGALSRRRIQGGRKNDALRTLQGRKEPAGGLEKDVERLL